MNVSTAGGDLHRIWSFHWLPLSDDTSRPGALRLSISGKQTRDVQNGQSQMQAVIQCNYNDTVWSFSCFIHRFVYKTKERSKTNLCTSPKAERSVIRLIVLLQPAVQIPTICSLHWYSVTNLHIWQLWSRDCFDWNNLLSEQLQIDFLLISLLIYQVQVELDPQLSLGPDICTTLSNSNSGQKQKSEFHIDDTTARVEESALATSFFCLKLFVAPQHTFNCIPPAETCVKQRHLHCKANLTLWLCWGTPSREAGLNEKCRLQRATLVCRPRGLSHFYYSQAIGRALMYGGRI